MNTNRQNWLIYLRSLMYGRRNLYKILEENENDGEGLDDSITFPASRVSLILENESSTTVQAAIDILRRQRRINREVIATDKQLTNEDPAFQHLISHTPNLEIFLPPNPIKEQFFALKNSKNSTENIVIAGVIIEPQFTHEVLFDGTEWTIW